MAPGKTEELRNGCRSCAAVVVADCIAVCCCPCAIPNFLVLTLLKVPWVVGRRWLGLKKKKKKRGEATQKEKAGGESGRKTKGVASPADGDGSLRMRMGEELSSELELWCVGDWGFGRVSVSEIPREGI